MCRGGGGVRACVCVYIYRVSVRVCACVGMRVRARAGFIGGPLQGLQGNGIPDHQLQPQSTHEQRGNPSVRVICTEIALSSQRASMQPSI